MGGGGEGPRADGLRSVCGRRLALREWPDARRQQYQRWRLQAGEVPRQLDPIHLRHLWSVTTNTTSTSCGTDTTTCPSTENWRPGHSTTDGHSRCPSQPTSRASPPPCASSLGRRDSRHTHASCVRYRTERQALLVILPRVSYSIIARHSPPPFTSLRQLTCNP
jgi:hypothetical protein